MQTDKLALVAAGGLALAAFIRAREGGEGGQGLNLPAPAGDVARDVDILARTMWAEARGEGVRGMQAVANVIINRADNPGWWGHDITSVCLYPWQFSAWNPTDPNASKAANVTTANAAFRAALDIAARAVAGTLPDITGGATHYHAPSVSPSWADQMTRTAVIGNHTFYV